MTDNLHKFLEEQFFEYTKLENKEEILRKID